jgi:hypothetical protein
LAFRNDGNTGDIEAVTMQATNAIRIGSSAVAQLIASISNSGTFDLISNGVAIFTSTLSGMTFGRLATMAISQPAASGAAGTAASFLGQAGDAGFDGADVTIASGAAGSGSNPGKLILDAKSSTSASGRISLRGGSFGEFVGISFDNSASRATLEFAGSFVKFDTAIAEFDSTNLSIFASPGSFGGGTQMIFIANTSGTPGGTPSGGGLLYVEAGSLKFKGSSGTVTTIAAA